MIDRMMNLVVKFIPLLGEGKGDGRGVVCDN